MCFLECLQEFLEFCGSKPRVFWKIGPFSEAGAVAPSAGCNHHRKRKAADLMLILTDSQQVVLSVAFLDKKGNPAQVDGAPQWTVSDAALLSVTAAADGMSATVAAMGPTTAPNASVQVSVTADVDLGAGLKPLIGTLDVSIVAGEAVQASINAGTPTEQP